MPDPLQKLRENTWDQTLPPREVVHSIAQLNPREKILLYHIARDVYSGYGDIIDAGAFLGGSAVCLAAGLRDNPWVCAKDKRIHSFDDFKVLDVFNMKWFPSRAQPGEDFLPIYQENTQNFSKYLEIHRGNIQEATWNKPIEILFLDVCKSIPTTDRVTEIFFPHLTPGRSLLIQQDYLCLSWSIWLYVTMYMLEEYFERITYYQRNSVVYQCIKKIPPVQNVVGNFSHEERVEIALKEAKKWDGRQKEVIENSIEMYRQGQGEVEKLP